MTIAKGTRLGAHEVIDFIGAGGMGEVYRALDTKLGREVARKLNVEDRFYQCVFEPGNCSKGKKSSLSFNSSQKP